MACSMPLDSLSPSCHDPGLEPLSSFTNYWLVLVLLCVDAKHTWASPLLRDMKVISKFSSHKYFKKLMNLGLLLSVISYLVLSNCCRIIIFILKIRTGKHLLGFWHLIHFLPLTLKAPELANLYYV